jgi:hypothetical protein
MASMAQKIGVMTTGFTVLVGGLLTKQVYESSRGLPEAVEIDKNTFYFKGSYDDNALTFGKKLAEFRNKHPGDWVLIPRYGRQPTLEVYAVRKSVVDEHGQTNAIATDQSPRK